MSGAGAEFNVELRGGEEIRVPEAGKIFVVGNVKKPGAFAIENAVRDECAGSPGVVGGAGALRDQGGLHLPQG